MKTAARFAGWIASRLAVCWSSPESRMMRWSMTDESTPNFMTTLSGSAGRYSSVAGSQFSLRTSTSWLPTVYSWIL